MAGASSGEVEATIRRSPTAPPESLAISALLPNSVGMALGVLALGGRERGGEASRLRVSAVPASLHVCPAASFE
eukprot:6073596-Pleurochrysis_carterae.AAC.1